MQDRPDAGELLRAVRAFLEVEVVPRFEGRRRFHALVAANLLAVLERERELEEDQLVAEWGRLAELHGHKGATSPARLTLLRDAVRTLTHQLSERIRAGDADDPAFGEAVRRHLRATVVEKLRIASPRHLDGR
jgi:Domain of unknown function (DUF6285)